VLGSVNLSIQEGFWGEVMDQPCVPAMKEGIVGF
jgi:hypothetical protein